jgi:hypothetical protein
LEISTIVDAGPLIGWLNATDQWHRWSVDRLSRRLRNQALPLITPS